jgi:hypothetical protein
MLSNFAPEWLNTLNAYIEKLERSFLEGMVPDAFQLADLLENEQRSFFRIRGLANFWSERPGINFGQHITDLVTRAHSALDTFLTSSAGQE